MYIYIYVSRGISIHFAGSFRGKALVHHCGVRCVIRARTTEKIKIGRRSPFYRTVEKSLLYKPREGRSNVTIISQACLARDALILRSRVFLNIRVCIPPFHGAERY